MNIEDLVRQFMQLGCTFNNTCTDCGYRLCVCDYLTTLGKYICMHQTRFTVGNYDVSLHLNDEEVQMARGSTKFRQAVILVMLLRARRNIGHVKWCNQCFIAINQKCVFDSQIKLNWHNEPVGISYIKTANKIVFHPTDQYQHADTFAKIINFTRPVCVVSRRPSERILLYLDSCVNYTFKNDLLEYNVGNLENDWYDYTKIWYDIITAPANEADAQVEVISSDNDSGYGDKFPMQKWRKNELNRMLRSYYWCIILLNRCLATSRSRLALRT